MSTLKKVVIVAGIIIVLLIAIPLIAALFISKDYAVEREIIIDRPVAEVFEYVKYLRNQDNFSKWATLDPDMRQEFSGTDGTVGFKTSWEGNEDVGKGEQTIVNIVDGERIDYEILFIEPFSAQADSYMSTEAVSENQTKVTWAFSSTMPYPFNIMRVFMNLDAAIGDDLHVGLVNLKNILEEEE
jgi:uncharacterized protein YndB with AHSA1/START domain